MRVLSWNVWGVPRITPHLAARLRALPGVIAARNPDLILLQELWEPEHAQGVASALERRGYRYTRHLARSPHGETGLFVASKWPLSPIAFQSFQAGRLPHSFWHLDWMVSKGVGSFWLETPVGRVLVENTHLQAQYATDRYEGERLSQAGELVLMNSAYQDTPLILGGDFNSGPGESPRRALAELGGLVDAAPGANEDTVYVRNGLGAALRVQSARALFGEPRLLDDGGQMPLSDHLALEVDIELSRCAACDAPSSPNVTARNATLTLLGRASDITRGRVAAALLASSVALGIAVLWRRRLAGSAPAGAGWLVHRVGFTLLMLGFVWSFYLGTIYYPTRASVLDSIARELSKLKEARPTR